MKTLDEHNAEQAALQEAITRAANKAGVTCPKCGEEMTYYGETVLLTNPTKRHVVCGCGHSGYKVN